MCLSQILLSKQVCKTDISSYITIASYIGIVNLQLII